MEPNKWHDSLSTFELECHTYHLNEKEQAYAIRLVFPKFIVKGFEAMIAKGQCSRDLNGLKVYFKTFFTTTPEWTRYTIAPTEMFNWNYFVEILNPITAECKSDDSALWKLLVLAGVPEWARPAIRAAWDKPMSEIHQVVDNLYRNGAPNNSQFAFMSTKNKNKSEKKMMRTNGVNNQSNNNNNMRNNHQRANNNRGPFKEQVRSDRNDLKNGLCWAHNKFGDRAFPEKCIRGCRKFQERNTNGLPIQGRQQVPWQTQRGQVPYWQQQQQRGNSNNHQVYYNSAVPQPFHQNSQQVWEDSRNFPTEQGVLPKNGNPTHC